MCAILPPCRTPPDAADQAVRSLADALTAAERVATQRQRVGLAPWLFVVRRALSSGN